MCSHSTILGVVFFRVSATIPFCMCVSKALPYHVTYSQRVIYLPLPGPFLLRPLAYAVRCFISPVKTPCLTGPFYCEGDMLSTGK